MKDAWFLAFDFGASSGRAVLGRLASGKWTLEEVHRFPNVPLMQDGNLVWDFPRLQDELHTGLRLALSEAPGLSGIGIDTWGVDYVMFDRRTGGMLRMPSHYRDARTLSAETRIHRRIMPAELYRRTGIQHLRINTLYQLEAHRRQHPEDFNDSYFLMMADALGASLGGDRNAEYSNCSTSNLLDVRTRQWDWDLIRMLDLPCGVFPAIVPPCSHGGVISEELRRSLRCDPIPIWKVASHDTASAVAAVPFESKDGGAYISSGTWALLGTELTEPCLSRDAESHNFTNEGGVNGTVRFLTNIMGSWLLQEIRRTWDEAGNHLSFPEMEKLARNAGSCRFLINPNDAGFIEQGDMPSRIRAYCDMTGQGRISSDGELLRTVYDSLALCFSVKLQELEHVLDRRYPCLHIVGGGTRDHLLMQLTADASGRKVVAGPVEATAIGNLLGQAMAAGMLDGVEQARQTVRDSFPLEQYEPNPDVTGLYRPASERLNLILRKASGA